MRKSRLGIFSTSRFLILVTLLVWCALLLHLGLHHEDGDHQCTLCNSTHFVQASEVPSVDVTLAVLAFVENDAPTMRAASHFHLVPSRAPPTA